MMDLTVGQEAYSYFWVAVIGFLALAVFGAGMLWLTFRSERQREVKQESRDSQYYSYEPFDGEDYVMLAVGTVLLAFVAVLPTGAITQTDWYENHSPNAALVHEVERVYDLDIGLTEAGLLLAGQVVPVGDEFLKLDEDILVKVDSFSPLD